MTAVLLPTAKSMLGMYSVRAYGAKGNGTTDDTAAVQAALTACSASTYGGIVWVPPGLYKMTDTLTMGRATHLMGANWLTRLYWPTDLGSGRYAINYGSISGPEEARKVSHIGLVGGGPFVAGTPPRLMKGFRTLARDQFNDVMVNGFYSGITIDNDHQLFTNCTFTNCHYNVDFDHAIGTGNQCFINCSMTGATMASVRVEGSNTIGDVSFIGGHVGFAPYGFLRTDMNDGTPNNNTFMFQSVIQSVGFEEIGNGAIRDKGTGAADCLKGVQIFNPGFTWNAGLYRYSGDDHDYALNLRFCEEVDIWGGEYPYTAGAVGTITFQDPGAPSSFRVHGTTTDQAPGWTRSDYGIWQSATGTIVAGDLLEWSSADHVQRYGTSTNVFAGVALTDKTGSYVHMQERYSGYSFPNFEACTITMGANVCPDATVKHHANVGGTPVIGVARQAATLSTPQRWKGVYLT